MLWTTCLALAFGATALTGNAPPTRDPKMTPLPPNASLQVDPSHRILVRENGTPFVWLGDTAWELFHRLNQEEATTYLDRRAGQGFDIVQAVVLAELDGLHTPNANGDRPLIDDDPRKPNEAYFTHVDAIVDMANRRGIFIGMLPTWGDKLPSDHPATGPIVFNPENAYDYGKFLGKRYRSRKIVWILGGDRNVDSPEAMEIWRAMARGLREGDGGRHLITFHPRGGSSSADQLHSEAWLDFNMYQSGHSQHANDVYRYAQASLAHDPPKPVVDGEPAYEDLAIGFWKYSWSALDERGLIADRGHYSEGFFDARDVRVHAYWDFLAGACGYTYGSNAIWQMYSPGKPIAVPCLYDWRESLSRPGAEQMRHVRSFFERFALDKIVPDDSLVEGENPGGWDHVAVAKSRDRSFALVYLAKPRTVRVKLGSTAGTSVLARWYDPRTGKYTKAEKLANEGVRPFDPPAKGADEDWMLVLEKA